MVMGAAGRRRELGNHSHAGSEVLSPTVMAAPSWWEQPFILPVLEGARGWVLEHRHDI